MASENPNTEESAQSRRDALKKLGLGAGVAWTAPMAMSFYSQAGAQGPGSPPPNTVPKNTLPPVIPGCEQATCTNFVECSSSNLDCVCISTPDGGFCMPGSTPCGGLEACGPDLECPPGHVCAVDTCCGTPLCAPVSLVQQCPPDTSPDSGATSASSARQRVSTGAGTIGG